jgi:hypothetical protein
MKRLVLLFSLLLLSVTVIRGDRAVVKPGSATDPSVAIEGDLDTGVYSAGAGQLNVSLNGTNFAGFSSARLNINGEVRSDGGSVSAPAYHSDVDVDTGLYFPAGSQLAYAISSTQRHFWDGNQYTLTGSSDAIIELTSTSSTATDSYIYMGPSGDIDQGLLWYDVGLEDLKVRVGDVDIARFSSSGLLIENATTARLRLDSNSDVGFGIIEFGDISSNDSGRIHYTHSTDRMSFYMGGNEVIRAFGTAGGSVAIDVPATTNSTHLCVSGSGSIQQITVCSSTRRLKHDIEDLPDTYVVEDFRPVKYKWNGTNEPDIGFIAEEVAEVAPELAGYSDKGEVESVKYSHMIAIAFAEIQRLKKRIEQLEAK